MVKLQSSTEGWGEGVVGVIGRIKKIEGSRYRIPLYTICSEITGNRYVMVRLVLSTVISSSL